MNASVVIMGVSGCGKSSLAAGIAAAEQMTVIEGDDWHSPENREKMRQGIALTDADRVGWLADLAQLLRSHPAGHVLTCSALRRAYRDQLRQALPPPQPLRFVFLDLSREAAITRVTTRAAHYFSATLVDSQFATLESPAGELGVLRADALAPLNQLQAEVSAWLRTAP